MNDALDSTPPAPPKASVEALALDLALRPEPRRDGPGVGRRQVELVVMPQQLVADGGLDFLGQVRLALSFGPKALVVHLLSGKGLGDEAARVLRHAWEAAGHVGARFALRPTNPGARLHLVGLGLEEMLAAA